MPSYALAALARVLIRTGGAGRAASLLDRAQRSAVAHDDRQARSEVRRAAAEMALLERRPQEALAVLDGAPDAPIQAAWAELLSGRPDTTRALAAAELARARLTGERIVEAEIQIALAVSLSRLGDDDGARQTLSQAETLVLTLPYPAGMSRAAAARRLMSGAGS